MCLIFLAVRSHPRYKLIVAANRDEAYARPTTEAAFWSDYPDVLGGRDLIAMGTWLGMTRCGRLAMVTNFRDMRNIREEAPSRGDLVKNFLITDGSGESYLHSIAPRAKEYNGFSLIAGSVNSLHYLSNHNNGIIHLDNGLFGLSNHLLETPWPKVIEGKQKIQRILGQSDITAEELFEVLSDETVSADELLPDTGVGLDGERLLSPAFIRSDAYGTRSSTVILVDSDDHVLFSERVFDPVTSAFSFNTFEFPIA